MSYTPPSPLQSLAPIKAADYTWRNQGSATVADTGGVLCITAPASGSTSWRIQERAHTAPAIYTTYVQSFAKISANIALGIGFLESGTAKLLACFQVNSAPATILTAAYYTNPTTYSSSPSINLNPAVSPWMRIQDDSTNLIFSSSPDGINWTVLVSLGRTAFMSGGPDRFFFAADSENNQLVMASFYGLTIS